MFFNDKLAIGLIPPDIVFVFRYTYYTKKQPKTPYVTSTKNFPVSCGMSQCFWLFLTGLGKLSKILFLFRQSDESQSSRRTKTALAALGLI